MPAAATGIADASKRRDHLTRSASDTNARLTPTANRPRKSSLAELKRLAASEQNLMPAIIEAARVRATEGEMIAAMQEVFGTYTESPVF